MQAVQTGVQAVRAHSVGRGAERRPRAPPAASCARRASSSPRAKDAWLKFTSGRAENLPKLKQTLASVHKHAAEIGNGALMKLTAALVERLDKMPPTGVSEPLAMEYATGMLLAESAFENYASLSPDFPKQVDAMLARLDAARRRGRSPAATAPLLDEMSQARAGARAARAGRPRDPGEPAAHGAGARRVLPRQHEARRARDARARTASRSAARCASSGSTTPSGCSASARSRSRPTPNPETPVGNEDLELLAESLSGLGFYIEAVEQQRPDRERLIAPLLAKRLGEAPQAVGRRPRRYGRGRGRGVAQRAARARRRGPPRAGRRRGARRAAREARRACATTRS